MVGGQARVLNPVPGRRDPLRWRDVVCGVAAILARLLVATVEILEPTEVRVRVAAPAFAVAVLVGAVLIATALRLRLFYWVGKTNGGNSRKGSVGRKEG